MTVIDCTQHPGGTIGLYRGFATSHLPYIQIHLSTNKWWMYFLFSTTLDSRSNNITTFRTNNDLLFIWILNLCVYCVQTAFYWWCIFVRSESSHRSLYIHWERSQHLQYDSYICRCTIARFINANVWISCCKSLQLKKNSTSTHQFIWLSWQHK